VNEPPAESVSPCATSRVFLINEFIDVSGAGRGVRDVAERHGFSRIQAYYLVIAAIELGNNIVAHAGGRGRIAICYLPPPAGPAIEILAEDRGPGIPDLERALSDGFSTNGGLGCGLPGVRRLMDEFELRSAASGTWVRARRYKDERRDRDRAQTS